MRTELRTVTTIIADEGKLLRRKSDQWVAGEQVTLGYNYYEGGVGLSEAKLETPEDYEEFDKPEDYDTPEIINHVRRIQEGERLLENVTKRMEEERENINNLGLSGNEALQVKDMFPVWSADSVSVKAGERYQCDDLLWECIKDHVTQELWKPSVETSSLWKIVDEDHTGTQEDPIPYTQGMSFEKGKYYELYGVIYLCILTTSTGYPYDLKDMPTIVTKVQ